MQLHSHAITQIASKLNIPTDYLRKLAEGGQEQRDLAAINLNAHRQWMPEDKRFLVRAIGNEVRGVLSDTYKRIDSKLILNAFFGEVAYSEAALADACLTPTRYWAEALIPTLFEVPTEKNGSIFVAFGVRAGNSDFGDGALDIRSYIMQGVCMNGMVRETLMRKVHLGSKIEDDLQLSEKTYRLQSETMASAVTDITRQALNTASIRDNIARIKVAADTNVSLDREFLKLATTMVTKGEIIEIKNIMAQNNPDDGVFGEATLWKLTQGITACGRNAGGRRERELAQIAGELLERTDRELSLAV